MIPQKIIVNFIENLRVEPLLYYIHHKLILYLSTDDSRENSKSGGGWITETDDGTNIVNNQHLDDDHFDNI